jgi:hypothetical protein
VLAVRTIRVLISLNSKTLPDFSAVICQREPASAPCTVNPLKLLTVLQLRIIFLVSASGPAPVQVMPPPGALDLSATAPLRSVTVMAEAGAARDSRRNPRTAVPMMCGNIPILRSVDPPRSIN